MRILTYKRTHTGDPDVGGQFGIRNCMGRVRSWHFEAVIGVGGQGAEPAQRGIAGRVTWVGVNPIWTPRTSGPGHLVTFGSFKLCDQAGPLLRDVAPLLAARLYERKARILLHGYSREEQAQAEALIPMVLAMDCQPVQSQGSPLCCRSRGVCAASPCGSTVRTEDVTARCGAPWPARPCDAGSRRCSARR